MVYVPIPPSELIDVESGNAQQAVANGVLILDDYFGPGWRENIDTATLDLDSLRDCILGQLFGHYCDGLAMLGNPQPHETGFSPEEEVNGGRVDLETAWARELAATPAR